MTREKLTTGLQKAVKMHEVPAEKFGAVVKRTILGTLLIGVGIAGLAWYEMNHYLSMGMVLLGATVWSTQLVTNSLKALIQPIAAIKRAVADGD